MTEFHAAFAEAMAGRPDALRPFLAGDACAQAALSIYLNTTIKARIDALESNYPTVCQLVGVDWFRAAASIFVADQPGNDAVLADYGAGFANWLAGFEPARDHPYLAPCARLDRAWTEAHLAADAAPLSAADAARPGLALAGMAVGLHPSARLFWFDWSAPTIWLAHRREPASAGLEWRPGGEGLLIHRPHWDVVARRTSAAEHAFLQACRLGRPLGAAAAAAQGAAPGVDGSALFADLLTAGVFAGLSPGRPA